MDLATRELTVGAMQGPYNANGSPGTTNQQGLHASIILRACQGQLLCCRWHLLRHPSHCLFYPHPCSEEYLGDFMRQTGSKEQVAICTKFAPLPW